MNQLLVSVVEVSKVKDFVLPDDRLDNEIFSQDFFLACFGFLEQLLLEVVGPGLCL